MIDVYSAKIELVNEIKADVKQGLKIASPDRLTISPDCGQEPLPRETPYGKIERMVTTASEIEAKFGAGEVGIATEAIAPNGAPRTKLY